MSDNKQNGNDEVEYIYSTEELDSIIEKINAGITPMMNDQLKREVELRYKQLNDELFEEDEVDDIDIKTQRAIVKKAIEKKKREATKQDICVIKLSDKQKNQLHIDMSSSLVRKNPNDIYNLPDDKLYSSKEKKIVETKLAQLKNCYYNQKDYVNAIHIIQEAIEYSLSNDYPWMSQKEAFDEFNKGHIYFKWSGIPKLYINYATQVTDKELLKGIINGQIELKDHDNDDTTRRRKRKKEDEVGIEFPYSIISDNEYNQMVKLHAAGVDTPLSPMFQRKSRIYNRFSMPINDNLFGNDVKNNPNQNALNNFDWCREGAGEEYYNLSHNIKKSSTDVIKYMNTLNNKKFNNYVISNTSEFLHSLKLAMLPNNQRVATYRSDIGNNSNSFNINPQALEAEKSILNSIRNTNISY